jgi:Flp pilus assembly pilin Flp
MKRLLAALWTDESGATSIEYALLLGALAVGTISGAIGLAERMAQGSASASEIFAMPIEPVHVVGVMK